MKRLSVFAVFALALSLSAAPARAGQRVALRIGNNQPESQAWNVAIGQLRNLLEKHSDGRIRLSNYPNGTLGSEPDMLESVREGTLDLVVCDPTVGTTFCKELELFALPFLFTGYEQWLRALDGTPGRKYADLIEEKTGLKILAYWGGSERQLISVKSQIKSMGDLKGFKLRLAPSALKTEVWKAIGALPVTIAFGETYSALASGLCDGMENEMPTLLANKFYEPAKNLTLTAHEITVRPLFINAEKFKSLEPDLRDALLKAVAETTPAARKLEKDSGVVAREEMEKKYGVHIFEIDKKPFVDATKEVFNRFGQNTGLSGLIAEIQGS